MNNLEVNADKMVQDPVMKTREAERSNVKF